MSPEADAGESDARLSSGRRNTATCSSPEANADLPTLLEALPLLCRVSPEADADLAPHLGGLWRFRVIAPTYTHTSLTLLTVLCLSLFGFVELLRFVCLGGFSMWGFVYFSRSELHGFTWPALI